MRYIECTLVAHAGLDLERLVFRAFRRTLRRPHSVELVRIFPIGGKRIERAECSRVECVDNLRSVLVESPAAHASICTSHDRSRLQLLGFIDACKRVGFVIREVRAIEHGVAVGKVHVVGERVRILEERSLDGANHIDRRDNLVDGQETVVISSPFSRIGFGLQLDLRFGIEDVIRIGDIERNARERDAIISFRNNEARRIPFIDACRRRVIRGGAHVSELSCKLERTLIRTIEGNGVVCSITCTPLGVKCRASRCRVALSIEFIDEISVKLIKRLVVRRRERITLQAETVAVQSHREVDVAFNVISNRNVPVLVSAIDSD